jgi:hypothetical protein
VFLINPTRSQQNNLPEEIEKYYHERNFINSFSLRDERQHIFTLLSKGEDLSQLNEERLCQVAEVMKVLIEKVYSFPDSMNARPVLPIQLLMSEINQIKEWKIEKNHIIVNLLTYSIDHENNMKFIASYSSDQEPVDFEPIDLSTLQYLSQEIHEWYPENNNWKKSTVNKILVN